MPLYQACIVALSVSAIYLAWRIHTRYQLQRLSLLHRRVAHMLWVAAERIESSPDGFSEYEEPVYSDS